MPGSKIEIVELDEETSSPLEEVVRQVGAGAGGPVMVVGLEKSCPSTAAEQPVLGALNLSRPEWPRRLPRPVVLWVPEYLLRLLAQHAPDFLDWRSDTVVFAEPAAEELRPLDSRLWSGAGHMSMPLAERQERITELRSRLAGLTDEHDPVGRQARLEWLLELMDHLMLLGETERAEEALREAEELLAEWERSGAAQVYAARLAMHQGRILKLRGEVQEAARAFENARRGFLVLENERARAVAIGELARLKAQAGDIEESLRLHQEGLRIFERLGEVRERAVTLGDLAQIKAQVGETEAALHLLEESLVILERLGDMASRAGALGDLAQIKAQAGDTEEALRLLQERLEIYERVGDARGRALTLLDLARFKRDEGAIEDALSMIHEALIVFERLGDERSRAATLGILANLKALEKRPRESRALNEERLELARKVGESDDIASAQLDLARLDLAEGRSEEATIRLAEAWRLLGKTGRIEGIAHVGELWGKVLATQDQTAEALEVLSKAEAAFRRLGQAQQADQVAGRIEQLRGSPEPAD